MFQHALETISKQVLIRPTYDNFIGGKFVAPVEGRYFNNLSLITGAKLCQIARSTAADIDLALDAAHKAKDAWGRTPVAERSVILNKIADKMAANLDLLALIETLDNGKPINESRQGDLPLVVDCLRYYAGWADKIEGRTVPVRGSFLSYTLRQPVGVIGQIRTCFEIVSNACWT